MVLIVGGPKQPKNMNGHLLKLVVELAQLAEEDDASGCRSFLFQIDADEPALTKLLGLAGHTSRSCWSCFEFELQNYALSDA